jgi:sterol desaturase/sphingolipid hydroxylase (fatty acid hydroxylase superfamily)
MAPVVEPLSRRAERERLGLVQRLPAPVWLRNAIAVVLLDYALYWWHVLEHRASWLYRFHQVHHADFALDSSTALRFHFGEFLASAPWRAAQVAVIGASPRALRTWRRLTVVSALFHHSHVRLPLSLERRLASVVMTRRLHGIHHSVGVSEQDSNSSRGLTLRDRLHGTYRANVPQDDIEIGVAAYREPKDVSLPRSLAVPREPPCAGGDRERHSDRTADSVEACDDIHIHPERPPAKPATGLERRAPHEHDGASRSRGTIANIIGVHSVHPETMTAHVRLCQELMVAPSKLTRAERETVAVAATRPRYVRAQAQAHAHAARARRTRSWSPTSSRFARCGCRTAACTTSWRSRPASTSSTGWRWAWGWSWNPADPFRACATVRRRDAPRHERQRAINDQCEGRRRQCAGQHQTGVRQRKAGDDRLTEATGADERRERRSADRDHRRRAHARHDHRRGEWEPDLEQSLARRHPQRLRRLDCPRVRVSDADVGAARDRVERVEPERHKRRSQPDAKEGNHEREQRDARNRL